VHVNTPQIAGGLGGVRGELPLLPLLVAAELVDGAPQPLGSDELLIDELLHRFQMAHDGVPGMHPAWERRREGRGVRTLPTQLYQDFQNPVMLRRAIHMRPTRALPHPHSGLTVTGLTHVTNSPSCYSPAFSLL